MWIFFMFLGFFVGSTMAKELECFTTKNITYHTFPKYSLEGNHTETINYTQKDELRTGPPVCVMFYGFNESHSVAWQGAVSSFALPLQCHINSDSYTHCFHSPNKFTFLELKEGWACCCSFQKCNWNNPTFFQNFEHYTLDATVLINRLRSLASVSFCSLLFVIVVVLETVLEVLCRKWLGKGKKKSYELMEAAMENNKKVKETMSPSPGDPLTTPLLPQSSLKVESTQKTPAPGQFSTKSNKPPLSEITFRNDTLKLDKTQEDDLEETAKKPSELEPASTQKGEDSDDVPIPPKPEWKTTRTGRVKRTSMNYEESTYSDLQ